MYTLKQASDSLKNVAEYLKANEGVWNEPRDLKLHDVSYYFLSDEMKKDFPLCYEKQEGTEYSDNNMFGCFLNDSGMFFDEWLSEEGIDNSIMCYIGRTSKFYLTDIYNDSISNVIAELMYKLNSSMFNFTDVVNFEIIAYGEFKESDEEVQNELEYICKDFYNDTVDFLSDAIKVAEYIDSFKKNQVKYFKEFLENYEEEYQEEFKQAVETYNTAQNNVNVVQDKYKISDSDMESLKENFNIIAK